MASDRIIREEQIKNGEYCTTKIGWSGEDQLNEVLVYREYRRYRHGEVHWAEVLFSSDHKWLGTLLRWVFDTFVGKRGICKQEEKCPICVVPLGRSINLDDLKHLCAGHAIELLLECQERNLQPVIAAQELQRIAEEEHNS